MLFALKHNPARGEMLVSIFLIVRLQIKLLFYKQ